MKHTNRKKYLHDYWMSQKGKLIKKQSYLKTLYNITIEQYENLFKQQNGKCAICKQIPIGKTHNDGTLCVDHCHITGKVRGLLCQKCNRGIGHFNHNILLLESAIKYLFADNI